ncbi:hypothetical protein BTJ66_06735 [Staphylococcus edaphicus]|uniref:Competence protein ComGE n=1 Tax=Staphylococcus edaphicus TaxID=1955013 RepID=A0A2C6WPQ0_9STAP|nr:hypothetical protein BTJ66_06735 [Staphylococcus edaphicus]
MNKFNMKGSLFVDSLLSFSMITFICVLFIPMILQLKSNIQIKTNEIELSRVLLNSLHHYNKKELKTGITIDRYKLKLDNNKICITKKGEKYEKCFFK